MNPNSPYSQPDPVHPANPPDPNNGGNKDRQFATTLANGIDILLAFRPGESLLGNKDFVQRTGLSKSTVARLTHTLVVLGYLRHDTAQAKYRLGAPVLAPGYPLLASMQIRQVARPLMKALSDEVGGSVSLGIRERTGIIYVETARSIANSLLLPDIGATLPMLTTAVGKAWLSRVPADLREPVLNRLRLQDPDQFTRAVPHLAQARQDLATLGFCSNRAEWRHDVFGFAVPLCKPVDSQWFVVNCGLVARPDAFAALQKQVGPRLVTLAQTLEALLGLR
ncbi:MULTISPECIES: IclR family transcriptional regulator [unclassified Cupriavidus]|uniref:IclR family transcriptional regulator n=1 Tax=unclassified Cupriavidus TaxID=2640874 RepID=UPI001366683A|nr:IclR family transcriptional regulator [Cupriavidus sp. SW-Y-13]MWL87257.1 helix-turn-helix domain-containing protein [Cupriavidus sp. SW-Y-13]